MLFKHFGFTPENVVDTVKVVLGKARLKQTATASMNVSKGVPQHPLFRWRTPTASGKA